MLDVTGTVQSRNLDSKEPESPDPRPGNWASLWALPVGPAATESHGTTTWLFLATGGVEELENILKTKP